MIEAKKNKDANTLKEVKRLWAELNFAADMLNSLLAESRKIKNG